MAVVALSTRTAEMSPKRMARIIGLFFLFSIVLGGFGQVTQDQLVSSNDATTTAANVLAHTGQLWTGFALFMLEMSCGLVATAFTYVLLKPVDRSLSLLAACFSLVGIAIKIMSRLFFIAPVFILGGAGTLDAFTEEQLRVLALFSFHLNAQGAGMALIFFGFYALIGGVLVFNSTFLPRFLGVLGVLAGLGWLLFLLPSAGLRALPYITAVALFASFAKILWFLIKGVDEERWKVSATAARGSI